MTYEEFVNEVVKLAQKDIYEYSHFDHDQTSSLILNKIKDEEWVKSVYFYGCEISRNFSDFIGEDINLHFEKVKNNEEHLRALIDGIRGVTVKFLYGKIVALLND